MFVTLTCLFSKNLRDQLNFRKIFLNESVHFLKYSTFFGKSQIYKLMKSVELLKNLFEQIGTLSKIFDFSGKS